MGVKSTIQHPRFEERPFIQIQVLAIMQFHNFPSSGLQHILHMLADTPVEQIRSFACLFCRRPDTYFDHFLFLGFREKGYKSLDGFAGLSQPGAAGGALMHYRKQDDNLAETVSPLL